jgi:hypothetical protein
MPVLVILLTLAAIGVLVWLLHAYAGPYIAPPFLRLIDIVALLLTVWWLLQITGIWGYLAGLRL